MCGIGTTLVEAIHLGRRAIGVELEGRWARLAALNVRHAQQHGATGRAQVITDDAHGLARLLSTRAQRLLADDDVEARSAHGLARIGCGQVDLILTSPPYACHVADVDTENLHSGPGSAPPAGSEPRPRGARCSTTTPTAEQLDSGGNLQSRLPT
jgi:hypothetical protein